MTFHLQKFILKAVEVPQLSFLFFYLQNPKITFMRTQTIFESFVLTFQQKYTTIKQENEHKFVIEGDYYG